MKTATEGRRDGIQWTLMTQLNELAYADDVALLSHNHEQMQEKSNRVAEAAGKLGLKINKKKTVVMRANTGYDRPIAIADEPLTEVAEFTYLGSMVDKCGGTDRDVTARLGKARAAFASMKKIWASRELSRTTKIRLFNSNVKSVLLYGGETWRLNKIAVKRIQVFINSCLRRIFGIRWPEVIRNAELWEQAGQEPVVQQLCRRKWSWIGHTLRRPQGSVTRTSLRWNPQGKRRRGRPRNTWQRDGMAELKRVNKTWGEAERIAQDRASWRVFVDGLCSTRGNRP
jgi:hypothetical protein